VINGCVQYLTQRMTCPGSKVKTWQDHDFCHITMFKISKVWKLALSFFLIPDSQQTTNKASYDVINMQCPNLTFWGLGLQATKRWGSGLHGKRFRAPGLRSPPLWDPVRNIWGTRVLGQDMFNCVASGEFPAWRIRPTDISNKLHTYYLSASYVETV